MTYRQLCSFICSAILGYCASSASAAILYSDDFNADTSANYNKFITNGAAAGPSGDATFAYDYSVAPGSGGLSIPVAPHTSDASTIGLRLRTDNLQNAAAAAVVGATEIVTKTLSLPSSYKISVDVWQNYIGGTSSITSSGSNGTTGVSLGIGSAGTSLQYIAGNDGLIMEGFAEDGAGANQSYRIYTNNVHPNPTTKPYWAAGTTSTSASFSNAYYTGILPAVAAPAAQQSFSATQGGTTKAGTLGFAWHTWTITNDSVNVVWAIDGTTFTTVPVADFTSAGSQVSLGNTDTGTSGNTTANGQLLNAQIFDNFVISDFPAVPEPASCTLLGLGMAAIGLVSRRRRGA